MRRRWIVLGPLLGAGLLGLIYGVWWVLAVRRLRTELDQAEKDLAAGYHHTARERLARVAARWPGQAQVEFTLGVCEQLRGAPKAAMEAWKRVPPNSPPYSLRALLARGRLAMEQGQLSEAEEAFRKAARDPSPEAGQARHALALLMGQEGRVDEALAWIESLWRDVRPTDFSDRLSLLHDHIALEFETFPIEGNLSIVEQRPAAKDDDRIALSRANLAIRTGKFDDAKRWLDACAKGHVDDLIVWRSRLDLARASDDVDGVRNALGHLSADSLSPRRIAELRVWLAAHRGDPKYEQSALDDLIKVDPGNTVAIARLADLVIQSGDAERGRKLLQEKARLDEVKERYNTLFTTNRLEENALEMARLAQELGRDFEALGFYTITAQKEPSNREAIASLAKLNHVNQPPARDHQPLAQVLATEVDAIRPGLSHRSDGTPGNLPRFDDNTNAMGLAAFIFDNGASEIHQLPETMGGGIGLIDYDSDGWLDIYAVQGGPFPDGPFGGDRLFRNRRDGMFEDVTEKSKIAGMPRGYGHGVAIGDYDNNGHPDVFVTRWRSYALYRNRGDGTFEDVTRAVGFDGDRDWPTSAAWADLDNDGDLDLYVCHYGAWDTANPLRCKDPSRRFYITCNPREIKPLPDHVFRNDRGKFIDVTEEAGMVEHEGRGLGVVAADLDDDGQVDLFVANDSSANFLYHNLGEFRFKEVAETAGTAANAAGRYQAGMGVACGDLNGDGRPDLAVTNFYDESTTFYQNLGGLLFADRSAAIGLAAPSRFRLGFGIVMFDANNDGRLDLITANGHVHDSRPLFPFAMPAQLFLGGAKGRLTDVTEQAGPSFEHPHVGRGLVIGDLDNNGQLDGLMVAQNEPLVSFHNRSPNDGHFVTLHLKGTKSNGDAVGAVVTVQSGKIRQVAQRSGGGSFLSASDPRLHFGLETADRIESLEIRWPSGHVDRHIGLAADNAYAIKEGDPSVKTLTGYRGRRNASPADVNDKQEE